MHVNSRDPHQAVVSAAHWGCGQCAHPLASEALTKMGEVDPADTVGQVFPTEQVPIRPPFKTYLALEYSL